MTGNTAAAAYKIGSEEATWCVQATCSKKGMSGDEPEKKVCDKSDEHVSQPSDECSDECEKESSSAEMGERPLV